MIYDDVVKDTGIDPDFIKTQKITWSHVPVATIPKRDRSRYAKAASKVIAGVKA